MRKFVFVKQPIEATIGTLKSQQVCTRVTFITLFFVSSNLGGVAYMESVCTVCNIAHLCFHAVMFREWYGKLGMICVAGSPNMAKTKDVLSALHMGSSIQYFYAMKVMSSIITDIRKKYPPLPTTLLKHNFYYCYVSFKLCKMNPIFHE